MTSGTKRTRVFGLPLSVDLNRATSNSGVAAALACGAATTMRGDIEMTSTAPARVAAARRTSLAAISRTFLFHHCESGYRAAPYQREGDSDKNQPQGEASP